MKPTRGAKALKDWMERTGNGVCAVATALGRSHVAVSHWKSGKFRPEEIERQRLDVLTGGAVPAASWFFEWERLSIEAVEPLVAPEPAKPRKAAA